MGGNFKIRALKDYARFFTNGEVYEFRNGICTWDYGDKSRLYESFEQFIEKNSMFWKGCFELIKEEGENKMEDLRELIKPCYVVRFRGEEDWCLAMNRTDGTIGFNSINNIRRGIVRMSSFDEKLLDNSNVSEYDIMEIRGYADVDQTNIEDRPLIWKCTEISSTQLKLEELEKKQREIADEMEKLRKEL